MLKQSLRGFSDLFLQQVCPLCDRPTPQKVCPRCWRQLAECAAHKPPLRSNHGLSVLAWGSYQGALKQAIAALKYNGNPQLAEPLGYALAKQWQQTPIATGCPPIVLPIPLHAEKLKARGFNQAELLARPFCHQTGLKLESRGLIRHRATLPQFQLKVEERQHNLAGAFALGPAFQRRQPRQPVLLLDDIYTTGATVHTAATELRRHQVSVCGVVVIARSTFEA